MAPRDGYYHLHHGLYSYPERMGSVPAPWRPARREEAGGMLNGPHGRRAERSRTKNVRIAYVELIGMR
jgi:hypothetical protein